MALVGAGGKTSAMFALGEEAVKVGFRVVLTTTTRIFPASPGPGRTLVLGSGREALDGVSRALGDSPLVVAGAGVDRAGKLVGLERDLAGLFFQAGADLVVVEADGAAGRPFKAPQEWEPVMPDGATAVVPVVGVDCLGLPLTPECVHRPEMVTRLAGIAPGREVTPMAVARVFLDPLGYRKGVPAGSRWIPLINKVDTPDLLEPARELADLLGRGGAKRVAVGSALAKDPVKEVLEY